MCCDNNDDDDDANANDGSFGCCNYNSDDGCGGDVNNDVNNEDDGGVFVVMVMMMMMVAFVEGMKKHNETRSNIFTSCEASFLSKDLFIMYNTQLSPTKFQHQVKRVNCKVSVILNDSKRKPKNPPSPSSSSSLQTPLQTL